MSPAEQIARSDAYERSSMTVGHGLNFFAPQTDLLGPVLHLQRTKYLPQQLIDRYLTEALKRATFKQLEDGRLFMEIPGFDGVWASDEELTACATQLRDALFDWLVLKIEQNDRDIPVVSGISLNVL